MRSSTTRIENATRMAPLLEKQLMIVGPGPFDGDTAGIHPHGTGPPTHNTCQIPTL